MSNRSRLTALGPWWQNAGAFTFVAAAVGLMAAASAVFFRIDGTTIALWPANAVPLALLLLTPPGRWGRFWLVVLAASLGAGGAALTSGAGAILAIDHATANAIEISVAIALAWLPFGPRARLTRLSGLLKFAITVGLIGPALGALARIVPVPSVHALPAIDIFRTWFAAHALGDLIFTIAGTVILNRQRRPIIPRGKQLRTWLGLAICVVVVAATFQQDNATPLFITPLLFAFLGPIAGFEATSLAVTVLAGYTVMQTAHGYGPIAAPMNPINPASVGSRILLLQGFILTVFAVALPIALGFERRSRLIAQLRQQKAAIKSRAARYQAVAEISADTILVTLQDGTILYASPAAERLIGVPGSALKGRSAFELMHPDDLASVREVLATLGGDNREVTAEMRLRHDGTESHVWTEVKTRIGQQLPNRDVELVSVVRDISARRIEEDRRNADLKRLDRLANTDPLTGLANRRRFNDHLDTEWRRALREQFDLALLLIDVDFFKAYNDHYGHPAGDEALRKIAAIVGGGALRPGDLATRIGGEEFAVILPMTFLSGARAVAERIQQGIRDIKIAHATVPSGTLSVSIGIDCARPDQAGAPQSRTPQSLMERADRALYQAKIIRDSIAIAP